MLTVVTVERSAIKPRRIFKRALHVNFGGVFRVLFRLCPTFTARRNRISPDTYAEAFPAPLCHAVQVFSLPRPPELIRPIYLMFSWDGSDSA
jgi:hypothetical protein